MNNVLVSQMIRLRKGKKWSLKRMAEKLGIDYRTLSRYEHEEQDVPSEIIFEYCKCFHVTLDYLCRGTEVSDIELYDAIKKLSPKQKRAIMGIIDSYK